MADLIFHDPTGRAPAWCGWRRRRDLRRGDGRGLITPPWPSRRAARPEGLRPTGPARGDGHKLKGRQAGRITPARPRRQGGRGRWRWASTSPGMEAPALIPTTSTRWTWFPMGGGRLRRPGGDHLHPQARAIIARQEAPSILPGVTTQEGVWLAPPRTPLASPRPADPGQQPGGQAEARGYAAVFDLENLSKTSVAAIGLHRPGPRGAEAPGPGGLGHRAVR